MKIKLAGWIALIFLGSIVVGGVWYFFFMPKTPLPSGHSGGTTLPVSGGAPIASSTTSQPSGELVIQSLYQGETVTVNDFIHNGVTVSDAANPDRYLLAGNLGYCYPDPKPCQAAPATNYMVYFNSVKGTFTIALTEEPIGEARLAMEQFLLVTLGITKQQMCNLNYSVSVTRYVNEQYAGKNLGFSFCPGAVALPK